MTVFITSSSALPKVLLPRPAPANNSVVAGGDSPTPTYKKKRKGRSLSVYNIFFQHERARILELSQSGRPIHELTPPTNLTAHQVRDLLDRIPAQDAGASKRKHRKTHGVVSFTQLNKIVSENWKALDAKSKAPFYEITKEKSKAYYEKEAAKDAQKQQEQLVKFISSQGQQEASQEKPSSSQVPHLPLEPASVCPSRCGPRRVSLCGGEMHRDLAEIAAQEPAWKRSRSGNNESEELEDGLRGTVQQETATTSIALLPESNLDTNQGNDSTNGTVFVDALTASASKGASQPPHPSRRHSTPSVLANSTISDKDFWLVDSNSRQQQEEEVVLDDAVESFAEQFFPSNEDKEAEHLITNDQVYGPAPNATARASHESILHDATPSLSVTVSGDRSSCSTPPVPQEHAAVRVITTSTSSTSLDEHELCFMQGLDWSRMD